MESKYILSVTADRVLTFDSNQIYIDATSNDITLTLPDVAGLGDGFEFIFQRTDSVISKIVTLTPVNATIDGASSAKINIKQNLTLVYTNGVWKSNGNYGRITQRVVITTQSATPTINTDNTDVASITGLAQAITSLTANLSGTPMAGDLLEVQITDDGTPRAITWGASFASTTVILPDTTVASTLLRVFFEWNYTTNKWDCTGTIGGIIKTNFWTTVAGNPVRVNNTSFTITDTANANLYDLLLGRTTVLKWTDSGSTKMAMIVSATYASNTVTITIIGDTLAASATMNTFKYFVEKAREIKFAIAGTIATGNDLSSRYFAPNSLKLFGADGHHGTAGTTNATTYSISKNSTSGASSILASDVSIASAATAGDGYTASDGATMVLDDYLTLNCTAVSTTAPIDAYITVFVTPLKYQYLN